MELIAVINAFAQSLATVFVAVTVFLTWRQLKESTRQTRNLEETLRCSVYQEIVRSPRELWASFFDDPELLRWYLTSRGIQAKEDVDNKIALFIILKLDYYENLYLQVKQGNITRDAWSGWEKTMKTDFQEAAFKEIWSKVNSLYASSFRSFVNTELIENYPK